ncbi:DMSO/TMAO reductase YedYZ molybdopterin-dependent catalytic subunit [Prauserella shujinwangii]|uniref:DMSO/TMAO reductase YedYZ molybdopterin-dependent catalytic subunit n=2 Tax=Prauserella shujinwangii TaxID=1453103 RepID=A0A2T0LQE9_9PSEU|nr:molybdopterin-dependent oxidoreductase [Prauserella shujinwangii]PRX45551.1 DMSO/TMAO reductase YedYZ molybdopterin-dependent catalytic subunit [Prauserella shujinwangii]
MPAGAAALTGVLALAAALAMGHLVAAFVGIGASPYLAVGNSAIDLTPAPVKDWAIETFGSYDKVALLGGMAVVMVLAAVVAGLVSRRSALPGTLVIAVFGVVGGVAVYTRPALGQLALLAPLAGLLAGLAVFRWLHALALRGVSAIGEHEIAPPGADTRVQPADTANRRRFLVGASGVALGAGVAGLGGQLLGQAKNAEGSRQAIGTLRVADPAPPVPDGADFRRLGTPAFLTPNKDFYRVDTALVVPQVRAEDWSLRVHGMVDRELRLDYADLRSRPLVERTITLCCVSNEVGGPYISTANFIGVELADVLAEAGVRPGAEQLFSTSVDGWTCGTPVEAALDRDRGALLAIGMNSEPLPLEHGFPVRMVVPGLYGYVSATKWLTDIEITTWDARRAYWLDRGWAREAPVKTQSRIDAPEAFEKVPSGRVTVAGIAWAQTTGIAKVEVSIDDGPWRPTELSTAVNEDTWRMWRIDVDLRPGQHKVVCRATDRSGYTQTDRRQPTVPDGATGRHTVLFEVT